MTGKYDDTCSSCKQGYNFQPETPLHLYVGNLKASNIEAVCPHCNHEQLIFVAYEDIPGYADHEQIKVLVHNDPHPDLAELADGVWQRQQQGPELPEVPRTWAKEFWDTLREFGGES